MVLVDPSYPGMSGDIKRIAPALFAMMHQGGPIVAQARVCQAEARAGKLKPGVMDAHGCLQRPPMFPKALRLALDRFDISHPQVFATRASRAANLEQDSANAIDPGRNYGDMPLVVLHAGMPEPLPPAMPAAIKKAIPTLMAAGKKGQERLARLSSRGSFRVIKDSSHYIQVLHPGVVIAAVDKVVQEARAAEAAGSK